MNKRGFWLAGAALVVLSMTIGTVFAVRNSHQSKAAVLSAAALPATPIPTAAVTATPTPIPTVLTPIPTKKPIATSQPVNTALCSQIYSQEIADLTSLKGRINVLMGDAKQLTINYNNLPPSLSGDAQQQLLMRSDLQNRINADDAQANTLLDQYSNDRTSYQNKLMGSSCWTQLKASLAGTP